MLQHYRRIDKTGVARPRLKSVGFGGCNVGVRVGGAGLDADFGRGNNANPSLWRRSGDPCDLWLWKV